MGERFRKRQSSEQQSFQSAALGSTDSNSADAPVDAEKREALLLVGSQVDELAFLASGLQNSGLDVVPTRTDQLPALMPSGIFSIALVSASDPGVNMHHAVQMIKSHFAIPVLCMVPVPSRERITAVCQWPGDDLVFMPVRIEEIEARLAILLHKSKQRKSLTYPFIERRRSANNVSNAAGPEATAFPKTQFKIDDRSKTVILGSETIHLTPKEYQLLFLLASDPGRVFSVNDILKHLWPNKNAKEPDVHQYIYLLRRKIEKDPSAPEWILTEQGFGYRLQITPLQKV